jgi:hypothetical protein
MIMRNLLWFTIAMLLAVVIGFVCFEPKTQQLEQMSNEEKLDLTHCIMLANTGLTRDSEMIQHAMRYTSDFKIDAWGTPLNFGEAGGIPKVTSAGPDKSFDTSDDVFFHYSKH